MAGKYTERKQRLVQQQPPVDDAEDNAGEQEQHPAERQQANDREEPVRQQRREEPAQDQQQPADEAPPAWFKPFADSVNKRFDELTPRQQRQVQQQQPQQRQQEPDVFAQAAELMFVDPARAFKMIHDHGRAQTENHLTQQYNQQQQVRTVFGALYDRHPYLKDAHDIVAGTINKNMEKWQNLKLDDPATYDTIAEEVDREVIRLSKVANKGKGIDRSKQLESGRGPTGSGSQQEQKPATIGSLLKDRRAAREKPASGRTH